MVDNRSFEIWINVFDIYSFGLSGVFEILISCTIFVYFCTFWVCVHCGVDTLYQQNPTDQVVLYTIICVYIGRYAA